MGTRDLPHGETRLSRAAALRDTLRASPTPRVICVSSRHRTDRVTRCFVNLTPEGGTDLRQAIDRVDKDIGLARVAALVLVSDGIDLRLRAAT